MKQKQESTQLFSEFQIAETDNFAKKLELLEMKCYISKIYRYIYPQLRRNPYSGPNIKKLKGEFGLVYRYRVGILKLFYIIDKEKVLVIMVEIEKRKDAYK